MQINKPEHFQTYTASHSFRSCAASCDTVLSCSEKHSVKRRYIRSVPAEGFNINVWFCNNTIISSQQKKSHLSTVAWIQKCCSFFFFECVPYLQPETIKSLRHSSTDTLSLLALITLKLRWRLYSIIILYSSVPSSIMCLSVSSVSRLDSTALRQAGSLSWQMTRLLR